MVEIVRLTEESEEALSDINDLLRQLVYDPTTYNAVSAGALRDIIDNKGTVVVIARNEELIIGIGILFIVHKFRGRYAYIEDMIVDEAYRGQGIGKQILDELIEAARRESVETIELSTRPSRIPANNLYKKAGFEAKD